MVGLIRRLSFAERCPYKLFACLQVKLLLVVLVSGLLVIGQSQGHARNSRKTASSTQAKKVPLMKPFSSELIK
jgi:hypothetical protein